MQRSYRTQNRLDEVGQKLVADLSEYAVTIRFGQSWVGGRMDKKMAIWYPHDMQPPIIIGAFSNETLAEGLKKVCAIAATAEENY